MKSEVSIQQAMIGFSIIGDCLSASPKFAETSAFVLMGEYDKELSHATAFNLNRINGNDDLSPESPEVKTYIEQIKSRIRLRIQTIIDMAAREDSLQSDIELIKVKAKLAETAKPHEMGTVAEIAAKYGISKSEVRRRKAEGTLHELKATV